MRAMWVAILWVTGVWAAMALGATSSIEDNLPSIHIVRVNDPVGMQGFDLKCRPGEGQGAETECSVTEVKASKTVQTTTVSLERALKIASQFLSSVPKEKLYEVRKGREPNPHVDDVLLVWNVQLGQKGCEGVLKRNPTETEREPALQRAVLMLESELGTEED